MGQDNADVGPRVAGCAGPGSLVRATVTSTGTTIDNTDSHSRTEMGDLIVEATTFGNWSSHADDILDDWTAMNGAERQACFEGYVELRAICDAIKDDL